MCTIRVNITYKNYITYKKQFISAIYFLPLISRTKRKKNIKLGNLESKYIYIHIYMLKINNSTISSKLCVYVLYIIICIVLYRLPHFQIRDETFKLNIT